MKSNAAPKSNALAAVDAGATATRFLDAAEILFSEHGYVKTSLRAIAQRADINHALINYHFKNKTGLYRAVFERRGGTMMQERTALLAAAKAVAGRGPIPLRDVIYAFVYPPLRMANDDGPGGRAFVKLQARLHTEPKELEHTLRARLYDEVTLKFVAELQRSAPHLSHASICWRLTFVMGVYVYVSSDTGRIELISKGRCRGTNLKQALPEILDFCERGFAR
jgi:AcrR family transcriptional regulator